MIFVIKILNIRIRLSLMEGRSDISKFEKENTYEFKNLPLIKLMIEKCMIRYDGVSLLSLERTCAENFSKKSLTARSIIEEQIEKFY